MAKKVEAKDGLVGMWFHSYKDEHKLCWQGQLNQMVTTGL
jgi:hypothetical protein